MADPEENGEETPKKKSKLPLILGLLLALIGGGGGFYATYSGILLGSESHTEKSVDMKEHAETAMVSEMPNVVFVPIDPLVISLGEQGNSSHLRFRAQLEVSAAYQSEVEMLMPRVVDVLNSYLRALEPSDFEANSVLVRLRAQMLRRIQIVTGGDRVSDLLIMEFVLN